MKKIVSFWKNTNLIARIAIGIVIGAILGILVPQATFLTILGTLFVGALKAIAPILVFVLVMSSLANAGKGVGSKFRTVIILYMITTLAAAVVAVIMSFIFPVAIAFAQAYQADSAAPAGITQVLVNLLTNVVSNPFKALTEANYLGILSWAVLLGLAMRKAGDGFKKGLTDLSDAVSQLVRWIISCAPFGIMGLVFNAVSANGLKIFTQYGKLLLLLVGTMLLVSLVVDPIIACITLRANAYPLVFRCLKDSGITAFFTRSSAANIPINMSLCERLGLDKDMYSVSIPLGATINMDGAAITITIMTLATARTLGIAVDVPTAILLSVLATLGACGASGVAGGSLLLIPMACSLFGISNDTAMQTVAVGMIIGVVQDSLETALNSSGDVIFAACAEYREWQKEGRKFQIGAVKDHK